MTRLRSALAAVVMAAAIGGACSGAGGAEKSASRSTRYDDLRALFTDWRAFQKPKLTDGVADYSADAMTAQQRELPAYERRLHAIDAAGWPVNQQVDWQIVRAEMSGLDFDHRVLKPWANNPAFYVTVFPSQSDQPAREGPTAYGSIELWTYNYPLSRDAANQLDAALRTVPRFLQQAKQNLVGNQRDLWSFGTKSVKEQSDALMRLAERVGDTPDVEAVKTTIQQ